MQKLSGESKGAIMKKAVLYILAGIVSFCLSFNVLSAIDLNIRPNLQHPVVRPSSICEAPVVVKPNGTYSEQSLFIKYSDHRQVSWQNLFVLHGLGRFTLN
jgi:hypothetical protein